MSECCKTGFLWEGKPTGNSAKIAGLDTYVAGSNSDTAILIIHDVYGWTFSNLRILADQYAKEIDATVYLPDFFDGEVISPDTLSDPEKRKNFDLMAFIGRNGKDIRYPSMVKVAEALRAKGYKKIGAIGFCYGGWAVFRLGAKDTKLVDFIATAHPSLLTKEEIEGIAVPTQVLSPEHDQMYTEELKKHTKEWMPKTGLYYEYIDFPGLAHGFATRGDKDNKEQKDGLEKALQDFVNFAKKQSKA